MDNAPAQVITVAAKYGAFRPINWAEDCEDELMKINRLWNRLVEIGRGADAARVVVECQDPEVYRLRTAAQEAAEAARNAARAVKAARAAARSNTIKPVLMTDLATARASEKAAWEAYAPVVKVARKTFAAELRAVEVERQELVKAARNKSGLYWANYNAVIARYDAARDRAIKSGAEVHFRRHDGSGQFYVQIQGGMTQDQMCGTAPGGRGVATLRPVPSEPRQRYLSLWMRSIEEEGKRPRARWLTIPVRWHRDLPEGAVIMGIAATREIVADGTDTWSVSFSLRLPAPTLARGYRTLAVHTGWCAEPDGDYRVATIYDGVAVVPVTIRGLEQRHGSPADTILNRIARAGDAQSDADTDADEIWRQIRDMRLQDAPENIAAQMDLIRRTPMRVTDQLIGLADLWRQHLHYRPDIAEMLADWVPDAKRHRASAGRTLTRIALHRREIFRRQVAEWLNQYDRVIIDSVPIATLTTRDQLSDTAIDVIGRRQHAICAPGELRAWLSQRAKVVGRRVAVVPVATKITTTCWQCGADVLFDVRRGRCKNGHTHDRDDNAVRNLYAEGLEIFAAQAVAESGAASVSGGRWGRAKAAKAAAAAGGR